MKRITKSRPPAQLSSWLKKQNGKDCDYSRLQGDDRKAVLEKLISDQGWICCYTGLRITADSSHIEHLYPQTLCRKDDGLRSLHGAKRDVDYKNLLAAHPQPNKSCDFGAVYRGSWWDEILFVHPLRADCESQFRYNLNGGIDSADGKKDGAAEVTINKLNLRDGYLVAQRAAAIDEFLFDDNEPLPPTQIERLASRIMEKDGTGKHRAFCFVLKQASIELLKKAHREHVRREEIHRRQRNKAK